MHQSCFLWSSGPYCVASAFILFENVQYPQIKAESAHWASFKNFLFSTILWSSFKIKRHCYFPNACGPVCLETLDDSRKIKNILQLHNFISFWYKNKALFWMIAQASYHHHYEFKMQEWIENVSPKTIWLYESYGDPESSREVKKKTKQKQIKRKKT